MGVCVYVCVWSQILNNFDPVIIILGNYAKKKFQKKYIYILTFIIAVFTIMEMESNIL